MHYLYSELAGMERHVVRKSLMIVQNAVGIQYTATGILKGADLFDKITQFKQKAESIS